VGISSTEHGGDDGVLLLELFCERGRGRRKVGDCESRRVGERERNESGVQDQNLYSP
jgi:hypothetical protein